MAPKTIRRAAEDSLRRLGTDHIDLYYSHVDDPDTPLAETLDAFDALVRAGTVRHIAASNFTADRLTESLQTSAREGFAAYVALQAEYNLVQREGYERDLAPTVASAGLACLPYVALARGFLTGKYRPGGPEVDSPRAGQARAHLNGNGPAVLEALDEVAAAHRTTLAAVALAWLAAQPTVATPLAGARNPAQLADLLPCLTLELTADELTLLDKASATPPARQPRLDLRARFSCARGEGRRPLQRGADGQPRSVRCATPPGLVAPPRVRQRRS